MKRKNAKPEQLAQLEFCDWVKNNYPDLMINVDLSGIRLTQSLAYISSEMRSNDVAYPDFWLYKKNKKYVGLCLEIKREAITQSLSIYKKDGSLKSDEHLEKQQKTLNRLKEEGWYAEFACGFEECKTHFLKYISII